MKTFISIVVALVVLSCFSTAFAEEEFTVKDIKGEDVKVTKEEADKKAAETDFIKGVKFGAGIMANILTGGRTPVESAHVVNNIVRVDEEGRAQVGVVAEFHTLWPMCIGKSTSTGKHKIYTCGEDAAQLGVGPSIGLKLGSNNIIEAIFLGPIFAFRPNPKSTNSFNVALGGIIAPKVKVLGDGIENGQPLPVGETEVRYKKVNKFGYAILLSFAW